MERKKNARDVLRIIGENVRRERKARGFTQAELADRFQSHENFLGGVERGERNISVLNLCYLAGALGVEPAALFAGLTVAQLRRLPAKSARRLRSDRRA